MPGDVLLVAAGERLGADGLVSEGTSTLDAALVTGESVPQAVAPGSRVFAGMVNLGAALRVRVTAAGERTLLAEIVRLVEAAERGRSRFVALADRVARAYAPVVHATALLTFLGWFLVGGLAWDRALLVATACADHHLPLRPRARGAGRAGGRQHAAAPLGRAAALADRAGTAGPD